MRKKYYIGFTSDFSQRLLRHNKVLPSKKSSFTSKQSGTWHLIYKEEYTELTETKNRERWFKSGIGREYIRKNIQIWINNISTVDPPSADF